MKVEYNHQIDWMMSRDVQANAELFSNVRKFSDERVFAPDIREHTANISCLLAQDGVLTGVDGFSHMSLTHPGVFTKKLTDGVIVLNTTPQVAMPPITLAVTLADCGGVTFSYKNTLFGVIHCGWKGVAQDIIGNAIEKLRNILAEEVVNVCFQISPMAQSGYQFGVEDFHTHFQVLLQKYDLDSAAFFTKISDEKGFLQLHSLIVAILGTYGVSNIHESEENTLSLENSWPSHRMFTQGHQSKRGRFLVKISSGK